MVLLVLVSPFVPASVDLSLINVNLPIFYHTWKLHPLFFVRPARNINQQPATDFGFLFCFPEQSITCVTKAFVSGVMMLSLNNLFGLFKRRFSDVFKNKLISVMLFCMSSASPAAFSIC